MNKITRILQAGSFAIVAAAMLAGPGVMQVQAKDGEKPVLAGPKAEKDGESKGKKFNGERKRGDGDVIHKLLGELNLTDTQKESVKEIMVNARTARMEWQKTNGEAMKALGEEMKAAREAKDQAKSKEVFEKMKALRESAPNPKDNLDKIRALLTTEQKATLDAKLQEIKDKRGAKAMGDGEGRKAERKGKGAKGQKGDSEKSKTQDGELDL